jgi:hypothetical protein
LTGSIFAHLRIQSSCKIANKFSIKTRNFKIIKSPKNQSLKNFEKKINDQKTFKRCSKIFKNFYKKNNILGKGKEKKKK